MNRYRYLLMTCGLLGVFVYLTTLAKWPRNMLAAAGSRGSAAKPYADPDTVRGAGLSSDEVNNIDIYKNSQPATVHITSTVYKRNFFFEVIPSQGTGSGFLISEDGKILTNNHVIAGSQQVVVTLPDQSKLDAVVLVKDPANDLGLIQVKAKKKLPYLRLGDSDPLQVGQKVLAIGNPFGLDGTLTTGIISSIGRDIQDESGRVLEGMVQTDAAINPGNSGGPLLDSQGNVIGINTAIFGAGGNIGIGFAMPINRAKTMLTEFKSGRSFRRARLGVEVIYVAGEWEQRLDLPAEGGLLVQNIVRGSSAAQAGLKGPTRWVVIGNQEIGIGGDFITAVDGKAVDRNDALTRILGRKREGDSMELTIYRGGRSSKVNVKLGGAPEEQF